MKVTSRRLIAPALVVVIAASLQLGASPTDASWNDAEWAHAPVGALDCADPAQTAAARGQGRVLSGAVAGTDLDDVAAASGVDVTNNGSRSRHAPTGATQVGADAYADPLDVTALGAADVDLSGILSLPQGTGAGALAQYARAAENGDADGASGYVTDSGAIAPAGQSGYPDLATVDVKNLLNSVGVDLGSLVSNVTDVTLDVGAVAGRANVQGCESLWGASDAITREYLASSVKTQIASPTVGALVSAVDDTLDSVQTAVDKLTGNAGVASSISSGVSSLLTGVLGSLGLGSVTTTVDSVKIDLKPVRDLLAGPIHDSSGVLSIDLDAGTVTVDTAALLAEAYPGQYGDGLNALPPNSEPLTDPHVVDALNGVLADALAAWVNHVQSALDAALAAVTVDIDVTIDVTAVLLVVPVNVATITASAVGALNDPEGLNITVAGKVLGGLINAALLTPLLNALSTGLGSLVTNVVSGAVTGVTNTLVTTLDNALSGLTGAVVDAVTGAYTNLFVDQVVSLTVNAQNDPATGNPEPPDLASVPDGAYTVAALRVGVAGDSARLYLGRGTVGPICSPAGAPLRCADY